MKHAGPWSDFAPRLLSALVLIPLALACLWLGGVAWASLLAAAAITLALEWRAMSRAGGLSLVSSTLGILYIIVALLSLVWLRADPALGRAELLFLLLVVWASDIGAYIAGRWIGGPRMAPAISPGKTWSGAIGGTLASVLAGLLVWLRWPSGLLHHGPWLSAAALALIVSLAAQTGDLLESAAKRRCGVKDSGTLIPGHGGLLDRVDGILLAAPVMAALGVILGRGLALWS